MGGIGRLVSLMLYGTGPNHFRRLYRDRAGGRASPPRPWEYDNTYANMSVRWAVLKLLAESVGQAMKSADMSAELIRRGNEKAAKATVSAVVSDMVNKRKELSQSEDGGYQLTENGKHAWNAIKHSPKYANRGASSASLQ